MLIVCVVLLLTVVILVYLWCVLYNGRKWSSPCQAQESKNKNTSLVVSDQRSESNQYVEYNYKTNVQVKTGSYKDKGEASSDSTAPWPIEWRLFHLRFSLLYGLPHKIFYFPVKARLQSALISPVHWTTYLHANFSMGMCCTLLWLNSRPKCLILYSTTKA